MTEDARNAPRSTIKHITENHSQRRQAIVGVIFFAQKNEQTAEKGKRFPVPHLLEISDFYALPLLILKTPYKILKKDS